MSKFMVALSCMGICSKKERCVSFEPKSVESFAPKETLTFVVGIVFSKVLGEMMILQPKFGKHNPYLQTLYLRPMQLQ
jgi:hypothetical protein